MHVAIIMDGNGRWARLRGLPRTRGHRAGAAAVQRAVEAAPGLGIRVLTLFAFSADNWKRPATEVATLMRLLGDYLRRERKRCQRNGVRLSVIGRRDRLPPRLLDDIRRTEAATAGGTRLHLRLAVDYSAREALVRAAALAAERGAGPLSPLEFARLVHGACHSDPEVPDVDLLIRTSGEQRLSDFLLWECAYAEMVFLPCLWPDFGADELAGALDDFGRRERRYGRLTPAVGGSAGAAS